MADSTTINKTTDSGAGSEMDAQSQTGNKLIPGSEIIGRGVYIRPRNPYELKSVLFEPEPGNGKSSGSAKFGTYTRKSGAGVQTYLVPPGCAVNSSPPLPSDQSFGQTLIEESWSRFGKQLSMSASASVGTKAFSVDASAFQANSVKSDEDSYYAMRSSFVPFWDLYMPSIPSTLSKTLIDLLPKDSNGSIKGFDWGSRDVYTRIFDKYGTHFIKNVWVGGKASLVFTIAKSSNLSSNEVRAAVQGSLGDTAKASASVENKTSLENFQSNSSCKVFGSGGDSLLMAKLSRFEQDVYNDWLKSVEDFPSVIQFGVVGIWNLIDSKDEVGRKAAEVLKEAYFQETSFEPLTTVISVGRYQLFLRGSWGFAIDPFSNPYQGEIKTISQVEYELAHQVKSVRDKGNAIASTPATKIKINQSPADTPATPEKINPSLEENERNRLKLEKLEKFMPVLQEGKYRNFKRPDEALSFFDLDVRRILFFKRNQCLLLDFDGGNSSRFSFKDIKPVEGYPKLISEVFPGIDVDRVDAALVIPPNKIYIFSGPDYFRVDILPDGSYGPATRESITKGWPGVDFDRLDTATYWKSHKVYFFYEDQFIRYDISNRRADPGYPKQIPSNYVEDWDFLI